MDNRKLKKENGNKKIKITKGQKITNPFNI